MERKAWPYMAGVIDSEGTICISKSERVRLSGKTAVHTDLGVTVSNSDVRLMKWITRNFGGVYSRRNNQRGYSKKDGFIYSWEIPGAVRTAFINGILPYLVLKQEQAKISLDYSNLGSGWNTEKRLNLAEECQRLNRVYPDNLPKFSKEKIAQYAAGFMDGDGSFFVARATLNPQISVTSKAFRMIRWFMANYGGRFTSRPNHGSLVYNWRLSGCANKERFLLSVIPYLELKLEQSKILLDMIRMNGEHDKAKRNLLAERCCALNNLQSTVTTDTPSTSSDVKIQSVLTGDCESDPTETLAS